MFAVASPHAVEAVVIRGFTDRQVEDIVQCLHSEFQADVSVKRLGRGRARRHVLGAKHISQAARRYLDQCQTEQVVPVANSSSSAGRWSAQRAKGEMMAGLALVRR